MWYVIQVFTGRELRVAQEIRKVADSSAEGTCTVSDVLVPQAEYKQRIGGQWETTQRIVFPGYVFVETRNPDALAAQLSQVKFFTRILGVENGFVPLSDVEAQYIQTFADTPTRIVQMSTGVIEGDQVRILSGPLFGLEGRITRIDRHKRVAWVEIPMMGRTQNIKLGLEIVSKRF